MAGRSLGVGEGPTHTVTDTSLLELDDIQHILLIRTPAITGRYEFLTFDTPAGGRAWLSELLDKLQSAADVAATMDASDRWVTLAFTWTGLRALGVPEDALASFPDAFREGMAARASILGDTGTNAPEHWVGGLAGEDLHAIAILFSRTEEQCQKSIAEHDKLLARTDGVRSLSYLDLNANPPFNYAHDHFGFRDRLSQPVMKGSGENPTPGSGDPLEPGEFILGYPDENGPVANLPQPDVLSRNGSFMAYRRLREHVGRFRDYLREHADTAEGRDLLAAKFMGRWRSGAPLVLAPTHDDPELGADPLRNNDFSYKEMDPFGYACPLGAHARRLNPRDTAHNMNRRRMIRRGATYGPALPDDAPDDGVDRGIAAFIIGADLVPVRIRAERVDQRQSLPRVGQRARPDLRHPGRHIGFHGPETAHPHRAQGTASVHHPHGRCLLLPAGPHGSPLSRVHLRRHHDRRTYLQPASSAP
jgi:deferrochelatase/peroxidase EfeB